MDTAGVRCAYDTAARAYAEQFAGELSQKPLDREMLREFARQVGERGPVCDAGCGHGRTTGFLRDLGLDVFGLDLSSEILREARRPNPGVSYRTGDMLAMAMETGSLSGIVGFYCIVHFSLEQVGQFLLGLLQICLNVFE